MMPAATPPPDGPVLRDIHLPPDPSWWPPAPGWWMLAALLLIAGALAWWLLRRRRLQRERIAAALAGIDALERAHAQQPQRLAAELHQLLRRAARAYDPAATHHRGDAWRRCLARIPVDATTLDRLIALEDAMFRPSTRSTDIADIAAATRRWLALALQPRRTKRLTAAAQGASRA
ncbi:DUF4381 domain-containing protein [Dyella marensis]|uniref:DUF4381 domain-containing protein n=1 Tax=Dyella TaxID=231454 RepID=UPI001445A4CB|nr:DUF4381 domain-containing protein [Dyella sp. SG609]NKJ21271.1 hypothetical protein [Dyella sp. SG609]